MSYRSYVIDVSVLRPALYFHSETGKFCLSRSF